MKLKPVFNKKNGQTSFWLKKSLLSKKFRDKLPKLKAIEIKEEDLDFDD